ncbi:MAG: tetratricopeptide repeat protein, partial [Myxococcota bacterium]
PGDPDSVDAPVREDPTSDTSDDVFGESMSGIAPENSFESDLEEIEFDDIEIDVDDASFAGGREDRADAEPHAEVTASESPGEPASESLTFDGSVERESNPEQIGEDIEEADFYLEQGLLDEAEAIYSRVLDVAPNHSHALVRMGEVAAQRGEDPGSSGAGIDFGASVTEVEHDVPDESESTEIGEELTDWGDGVSLADELSVDPIAEDLDGPGEIDEEELSVADLSVGSFDSVDATADDTVDSNGDTRGFPEAVEEGDASLSGEIEVGRIDVTEVDVDSDDSDSDAEDVADETDLPEFSLEEEFDHAVAAGESMAGPDVATREPAISELTVTSIDFGEDTDTDGDEAEAEPAGEDFGFDLAAEIGQALDADPNEISSGNSADTSDDGFAAVFAEFKKGVSETLSEGDYEAHYDLGIAYREMGLLDDAMSEFQAAMGNPSRRLGCLHLLGLCALDAGQPDDAIAHLQLAIDTDDLASEQVSALRFDLGRCFEQIGDIEAAKTEYQAVQAENPQFSDVGSRLEGIGNPDKPAQDKFQYESFDDFFTDSDDDDGPDGSDAAPERDESLEDVIAEPEDVTEFEPELVPEVEPETESEPEPELEPQPEPPRARKKRKISFF